MRTRKQLINDLIDASDFKDSEIVLNSSFIRDLFNDAVGHLKDATKIAAENKSHRKNIKLLKAKNTELSGKIRQLQAERDALLEYLTNSHFVPCDICKHDNGEGVMGCKRARELKGPCFEWRRLQKEE